MEIKKEKRTYKGKFSSHTICVLKSNCLLITLFVIGENRYVKE